MKPTATLMTDPLELEGMAKCGAVQLFEYGMRKLADDVSEPDKPNKGKRSFDLRFTLEPDEAAATAKVSVELKGMKLAGSKVFSCGVVLNTNDRGQLELLEVRQPRLVGTETTGAAN